MSAKKKRWNLYTLCMVALLTAMMVLIKMTISIQTPVFKFNFASLPVVLAAMIFGPLEGAVVAVLGEFIVQVIGPYGLAPTTFIYVWPPAIRALVVGFAAVWMRQRGTRLENHPAVCYGICIAGAVLTTTGNTFGMWVESVFYRTSFTPVLFFTPARYVTGVLTAVIIATICIPVMHTLRRSGVLKDMG